MPPPSAPGLHRQVASLASAQGGVLSRRQALGIGLTASRIDAWLRAGRLVGVHRGVYLVAGAELGTRGRRLAALLAVGAGAVLSHRTAAEVWRLVAPGEGATHITSSGRSPRSRRGVIVHTGPPLGGHEVHREDGMPVTSPERTLLDLAAGSPGALVERIVAEAHVQRLVGERPLEAAVASRHPGAPRLRRLLEEAAPTRSELERRMTGLVRAAGLPPPEVNVRLHGHEIDLLWRAARVVVETDGWAAHGHRAAFERDRARDARLHAEGYAVVRFTHRQVTREPLRVAATLGRILGAGAGAGTEAAGAGLGAGAATAALPTTRAGPAATAAPGRPARA